MLPTLKLGSRGPAVRAAKIAYNAWNARPANTTPVFGPVFRSRIKGFQAAFNIPQTGVIGPRTWQQLERYFNDECRRLLPAPLIEPNQGWKSLRSDLWNAYSEGRARGLTDLGTYNPASTLPSGRPSDHSVWPAAAFDLGFAPTTGWANTQARAYAEWAATRPEVEYVILGDRIWTLERGWHPYTGGGHLNHVHVSGRR